PGVGDLVLDQAAGDHPDHLAAGGQRRVGQRPHQADPGAPVHDLELARGQQPAQLLGVRDVFGSEPGARTAEDKNPFHRSQRSSLAGVIRRLPHVDRIGIEERAAQLGKRSIKAAAKQQRIRLAVSMLDLTALEGADTPGKVRHLCAKGVCPAPTMPEIPSVAAICVYPQLVATAKEALRGTGVKTASVATGFPAGQVSLEAKLRDTEDAVAAGADEIDMVISREAFLAGDDTRVMQEIVAIKDHCGDAHLKVILETAELGSY